MNGFGCEHIVATPKPFGKQPQPCHDSATAKLFACHSFSVFASFSVPTAPPNDITQYNIQYHIEYIIIIIIKDT
jgi:hypothetical protein